MAKKKLDVNENAFRIMLESTGQAPKTPPPSERVDPAKNPKAVAAGRVRREKSGPTKTAQPDPAEGLPPENRRAFARAAALKRWNKS